MKQVFWAAASAAILFCHPVSAKEVEITSAPSDEDYQAAEETVNPTIAELVAGATSSVFETAFGESPLYEQIRGQLPALNAQLNDAFELYGPIAKCELAQRDHLGSLLVRLTYVCQHERFLTRWNFTVVNTTEGWVISQVNFEDAR